MVPILGIPIALFGHSHDLSFPGIHMHAPTRRTSYFCGNEQFLIARGGDVLPSDPAHTNQ